MSIVSEDFKQPFTKPSGKRGYRDRFRERGPLMPNSVDPVRQMQSLEGVATEPGLTLKNINGGSVDEGHLGSSGSEPRGGGRPSRGRPTPKWRQHMNRSRRGAPITPPNMTEGEYDRQLERQRQRKLTGRTEAEGPPYTKRR